MVAAALVVQIRCREGIAQTLQQLRQHTELLVIQFFVLQKVGQKGFLGQVQGGGQIPIQLVLQGLSRRIGEGEALRGLL